MRTLEAVGYVLIAMFLVGASLTPKQCLKKKGRIVTGERPLMCRPNEMGLGSLTGVKGAALCCVSDAEARRFFKSIPKANIKNYKSIRDASQWRNPYLIVRADGIKITKKGLFPLAELKSALADIQRDDWPYGRVVAVQEAGIRSSKHKKLIAENLKLVLAVLKELDMKVAHWPSA